MKRAMLMLLCLLLAALPARAEEPACVEYADQGGVRVFVEDGKAGLMDAGGGVLLPAEYESIEPFAGSDFAVVRSGGLAGVVRRDGSLAVPCEWGSVKLSAALRVAVCWDDSDAVRVVRLDTGEAMLEGGRHVMLDADDRFITRMEYGEEGFGYDPPYHTDVYDADGALRFSIDAWLIKGFAQDYAAAMFGDWTYGMIDAEGNVIIRGLRESPWTDGQDYAYDDAPRAGAIHWVREVKNPLNRWLKPLKLDRHHVEYYLDLLGVRREGRLRAALMELYEDGSLCGVVESDGTPRFEMPGAGVWGPDDAGLYRVQTSGYSSIVRDQDMWVYVDRDGSPAIEAKYNEAYPFVDGAAVVCARGQWHLIDAHGEPVDDLTWSWGPDMWSSEALALPVIPIENPDGDGYRVIDRRGEYVTDEVFQSAGEVFGGDRLMLTDMDGGLCLMDDAGNVTLRAPTGDLWWDADGEAVALQQGGKWGVLAAAGARAGQWLVAPEYAEVERLENGGGFRLRLGADAGDAVYADRAGNILGPAPAFVDYDF